MVTATEPSVEVTLVGGRFHWHRALLPVGHNRVEIAGCVYTAVRDQSGSLLCYRFAAHMMSNRRELRA